MLIELPPLYRLIEKVSEATVYISFGSFVYVCLHHSLSLSLSHKPGLQYTHTSLHCNFRSSCSSAETVFFKSCEASLFLRRDMKYMQAEDAERNPSNCMSREIAVKVNNELQHHRHPRYYCYYDSCFFQSFSKRALNYQGSRLISHSPALIRKPPRTAV